MVNVSSMAYTSGKFNFEDLHFEKSYNSFESYSRSKLANIYFTREMSKRVPEIKSCSLHPGAVRTKIGRNMLDGNYCAICCLVTISPIYFLISKSPWWGA